MPIPTYDQFIDLQRVGGTGDAGIDGIISLDRLGFDFDNPPKPCAKADKRFSRSDTVGRPAVQEFYGALAGQRASKSIIRRSLRRRRISVSPFTQQAVEFVQRVERIKAYRRGAVDGVEDRAWGGGKSSVGVKKSYDIWLTAHLTVPLFQSVRDQSRVDELFDSYSARSSPQCRVP